MNFIRISVYLSLSPYIYLYIKYTHTHTQTYMYMVCVFIQCLLTWCIIFSNNLLLDCFFPNESEVKVLVAQSSPTLCDPMNCSPPGSSVHEVLQVRTRAGCHFLIQGIFRTRNRTRVSHITGRFFITRTTREVPHKSYLQSLCPVSFLSYISNTLGLVPSLQNLPNFKSQLNFFPSPSSP